MFRNESGRENVGRSHSGTCESNPLAVVRALSRLCHRFLLCCTHRHLFRYDATVLAAKEIQMIVQSYD